MTGKKKVVKVKEIRKKKPMKLSPVKKRKPDPRNLKMVGGRG